MSAADRRRRSRAARATERCSPWRITSALLSLALLALATSALGEPRELPAHVVWTQADRVYLASPDSTALARGARLTLRQDARDLATAEITQVIDGTLAIARVSQGSLAGVTALDLLRVLAEAPRLAPPPLLRVGVPAGARANLAIACGAVSPAGPLASLGYQVEPAGAAEWRGVRTAPPDSTAPWPDTLIVRAYRVAADEEIAFERGELDVAVFWPGELSAHLREDPRGRGALLGARSRGVIAALQPVAKTPADTIGADRLAAAIHADGPLAALNPQMFGGDLLPWADVDSIGRAAEAALLHGRRAGASVAVDPALPGQSVLQRFLDRDLPASFRGAPRAVHLTMLDEPLQADSTRRATWRAHGVVPLYAPRCPVVCASDVRAVVQALGAEAFADLPACAAARRRP